MATLILAALAAVMALGDMRPIHKVIYFSLIVGLVVVESRAIKSDRDKFLKDQKEATLEQQESNGKLALIAGDLQGSIRQSQQQFSVLRGRTLAQINLLDADISLLKTYGNEASLLSH